MNPRRLAVVLPIVILVISVVFAETSRQSINPESNRKPLELLGYNYNRQLVQLSVTLRNTGDRPITITEVTYDELKLTKGLIGSAIDFTLLGKDTEYNLEQVLPTNGLIFAEADHWNMDTRDSGTPTIQPNGIASMYLGVTSNNKSEHLLKIVTEGEEYVFTLISEVSSDHE